ncbi:MAG: co-chaperone GroES family protein [Prevotellaceae bacterium]|jgi:co-chaperonin GroES (HSP10)|nr:co-chaperone GroES family protein [Prevotellaceae bacterium]
MLLSFSAEELENVALVGDKVLIKPRTEQEKTKSGLLLPAGLQSNEPIYAGYVVKAGPGYPIPALNDADEPWRNKQDEVKYLPLQPRVGDLAVYLQNSTWEIEFNGEKYLIVPHTAILLLVQNNDFR